MQNPYRYEDKLIIIETKIKKKTGERPRWHFLLFVLCHPCTWGVVVTIAFSLCYDCWTDERWEDGYGYIWWSWYWKSQLSIWLITFILTFRKEQKDVAKN